MRKRISSAEMQAFIARSKAQHQQQQHADAVNAEVKRLKEIAKKKLQKLKAQQKTRNMSRIWM